mmetsp:Transcript_19159/g.39085  ORF Transcript_19159/g.39085 Transcript_19159/m.39085 type:complete len:223 (-) Transcript_19159:910-1578(-)
MKKCDNFQALIINCLEEYKNIKIKEKLTNFLTTVPSDFLTIKTIVLEEGDSLSMTSQMSLRDSFEKNSSEIRFWVTCDSISKINLAIFSRCILIRLNPISPLFLSIRLREISEKEKILSKLEILDDLILNGRGDLRKTICSFLILLVKNQKRKFYRLSAGCFLAKNFLEFFFDAAYKDIKFVSFRKILFFMNFNDLDFGKLIKDYAVKEKSNVSLKKIFHLS